MGNTRVFMMAPGIYTLQRSIL